MNRFQTLIAMLLCLACAGAQAQWQWIDKDGRKVFSDRAPPPEILPKNILKQPGAAARAADTASATAAVGASSDASPLAAQATLAADAPKLSTVDKDLAEKKRQAEAAEAAKAKAEDDRVAGAKVENCNRARAGKALMDSGVRMSLTNAKGEREVLEDAGRAAQTKQLQQQIDANCR